MVKVRVLKKCKYCNGDAFLPVGEDTNFKGEKYIRHRPCPVCEGSGMRGEWVELTEFLLLIEQVNCSHEHVTTNGSFHLAAGEVWDDIKTVCSDCGEKLI